MKRSLIFIAFLVLMIILIGCKDTTNEEANAINTENNNSDEEQRNPIEAEDKEEPIKESPVDYKEDIGNLKVWIGGEMIIEDDQIIVEGQSNLLPGSIISSTGSSTLPIAAFMKNAEVQADGSFRFEYPGYDGSAIIDFRLSSLGEDTTKHYGIYFNQVIGPQLYKTSRSDQYEVRTTLLLDADQETPYTLPIETPEWDELPNDYGDSNVWMDVEVTTDHKFIYVHGKSNLLEGTWLGGDLTNATDVIVPFSYDYTNVNPDGSFDLKIPYLSLRPGMYIPLQVHANQNTWDDVLAAYGEDFGKLEGDLLQTSEDGSHYLEKLVELDIPDMEPPEKVDLTVADEEIKMQVPDDLLFDFDESILMDFSQETLNSILAELEELEPETTIHINGHTDDQGDASYNLNLSLERAESVFHYLEEHGDISHLTIHTEGYGETAPIESNEDEDGRSKNRRVEIVINPES
ncbi:OmpA family protein [Oceanobacillus polygoni]|uniref:Outer membrane protein OmpA-like peptidoglycan-associated protein n=1 Tax=Oceanobacillus polygoni TaxID=1235259 RepID=A0A9X0YQV7_9BACI|nr:OmpA family protein [Oceanobacillus polygoni]MBP2077043.1 outer membrane protein OmpA-like peptidoglycan-associated protein [Oceanobacillus polygoni]